jgi:D-serine deaminase-like pyridoxal phosphate-dependent protein
MFSGDQLLSGDRRHYGYVVGKPGLILEDLSEEHGHLFVKGDERVRIGDRIRVVPNHVCPCINLQDRVYIVAGEQVLDEWDVAGRGRVN